jgi:hypothetical protein
MGHNGNRNESRTSAQSTGLHSLLYQRLTWARPPGRNVKFGGMILEILHCKHEA